MDKKIKTKTFGAMGTQCIKCSASNAMMTTKNEKRTHVNLKHARCNPLTHLAAASNFATSKLAC